MVTTLRLVEARWGSSRFAVELTELHSVLTMQEARGLELIQLSPWLGAAAQPGQHVGLLARADGPPLGLCLGQVLAFRTCHASSLMALPRWLYPHLSPIFWPACLHDPATSQVTWLLNLHALLALTARQQG